MGCKKCKYFRKEEDTEYLIVHLWESHGIPVEMLKEKYPEAEWEQVAELIKSHKETGRAGSDMFTGGIGNK